MDNLSEKFDELKLRLAENKVYDAWQFVLSLIEELDYMDVSHDLIINIYNHRKSVLEEISSETRQEAHNNPGIPVKITVSQLSNTNITVGEQSFDDGMLLKKNVIEFFHYARICIDSLTQIINAAIFGDDSYSVEDWKLHIKVFDKLSETAVFENLRNLLQTCKDDSEIKYLRNFDNYIKHQKTILVNIKNCFLLGSDNEFKISEFVYDEHLYPQCDAISKIEQVSIALKNHIEAIISELIVQIPNCVNTSSRFQNLKFRMQVKENEEKSKIDYIAYYIEVENDFTELPSLIRVMPLLIYPDNTIYSYKLDINEIFIVKQGQENEILGIAEYDSSDTKNIGYYRPYKVRSCDKGEYYRYIALFNEKYCRFSINFSAIEGEIISYNEEF